MRSNTIKGHGSKDFDGLNPQQLMFIKELLADPSFNYTDAARRAGYKQPSVAVGRLLKDVRVAKCIGKEIHNRADELEIKAVDVLQKLKDVINLDPIDFFDTINNEFGERLFAFKPLDEIPPHIRKCISKIESRTYRRHSDSGVETTETVMKIEFMSKDNALNLLMDHLGLKGKTRISIGAEGNLETLLGSLLKENEELNNVVLAENYRHLQNPAIEAQ
jgi:phage terminase small subunit